MWCAVKSAKSFMTLVLSALCVSGGLACAARIAQTRPSAQHGQPDLEHETVIRIQLYLFYF